MNAIGASFLAVATLLTFMLPRRWAALPLLLGTLYMTSGQFLELGSANFTILRLLVAAGFVRALMRGERIAGGLQRGDWLILGWAALLVGTSAFHRSEEWVYRLGMVWTQLGAYLIFRIFLQDLEDVKRIVRFVGLAAVPLAVAMVLEKLSGQNLFGSLGGTIEHSLVRNGSIRASGPFEHPILAGTAGAAIFAFGLALWRSAKVSAFVACAAGTAIVVACGSSGPILMMFFVIVGLATWRIRHHMSTVRRLLLLSILMLAAVMKAPVYFLIARVDIVGGSESWFRAQLIDSSIDHLSEWWFAGTDYTRHWMATGIYANDRNTDITNHFLSMGVMGGLPLLLVFVLIVVMGFRTVGRTLRKHPNGPDCDNFFVWCFGALLFGFVMDFFSITLFDQSVLFFWFTIAAIVCAGLAPSAAVAPTAVVNHRYAQQRHRAALPHRQ